jgi:hypothetical protein
MSAYRDVGSTAKHNFDADASAEIGDKLYNPRCHFAVRCEKGDSMEFYYHSVDKDVLILSADGGLNMDNADEFVSETGNSRRVRYS